MQHNSIDSWAPLARKMRQEVEPCESWRFPMLRSCRWRCSRRFFALRNLATTIACTACCSLARASTVTKRPIGWGKIPPRCSVGCADLSSTVSPGWRKANGWVARRDSRRRNWRGRTATCGNLPANSATRRTSGMASCSLTIWIGPAGFTWALDSARGFFPVCTSDSATPRRALPTRDRRMVLILDNARYHHARLLQPFLDARRGGVRLDFLPPYSPDLNPIERVWKLARKLATHNQYFPKLENLTAAVSQQMQAWKKPNPVLRRLCCIT